MMYGRRNQIQHDKRGHKKTDKLTGLTRIVNLFKNGAAECDENSPALPALAYTEMNQYQNPHLQLDVLQAQIIENMRKRMI